MYKYKSIYLSIYLSIEFVQVAIESWPKCDLNPRPLNSVQTP